MYISIKNVEIPASEVPIEKQDFKKIRKNILPLINNAIKIINIIANKPSLFKWRLKKFFSSGKGNITLKELVANKKKTNTDIMKELKNNIEKLKDCLGKIKIQCEGINKFTTYNENVLDKASGDLKKKGYVFSFHLIVKKIFNTCESSIKNFEKVFLGYPNEITHIEYKKLLGNIEGVKLERKYNILNNNLNKELEKISAKLTKEKEENISKNENKPFFSGSFLNPKPETKNISKTVTVQEIEETKNFNIDNHYKEFVVYDDNIHMLPKRPKNIFEEADSESKVHDKDIIKSPISCYEIVKNNVTENEIKQCIYKNTPRNAKYILIKKSDVTANKKLYVFGKKESDVIQTIKSWYANNMHLDNKNELKEWKKTNKKPIKFSFKNKRNK
jgi:hypothetical protein